jgi:uncharacterized caspase-like protein
MCNTPVEVQFTSAGCLNYPCRTPLGLVILDACRNNPFESTMQRAAARGITRGLAPVDPFENVLVAYAARDGTTANDGTGRNSPFTAALLRNIETPGLEIDFLFRNVRPPKTSSSRSSTARCRARKSI